MRIIQLLPTIAYGDAVGNDCRAIDRILKEEGYETAIYAENIDARLPEHTAEPVDQMPAVTASDIIIYHLSIGTKLNDLLPTLPAGKIYVYHNITPESYFKIYDNNAYRMCRMGREQTKAMAQVPDYCLADSAYNRQELLDYGYRCPIDVLPILIPFEDYEKHPDEEMLRRYSDGYINILFTGRVAPNKKHEDLIKAFYAFHRKNPESRLILAGGYAAEDKYIQRLKFYVRSMGLTHDVVFTGHIPFASILALYRTASVFWCMSEHEGFCVPLVEAMYFHIPIVAYSSTAVPWTLGGSGVLLEERNPELAAGVTERLLQDEALRRIVIEGQDERLKDFAYERTEAQLRGYLKAFIEKWKQEGGK